MIPRNLSFLRGAPPAGARCLLLGLALGPLAAAAAPTELPLGQHPVGTEQRTAAGTPVVPMWTAPKPRKAPGAGFSTVAGAEHFVVWAPAKRSEGAYNHFAALVRHEGRFFAMWGNHWFGEYGPGQRALMAVSADGGQTWSTPAAVFPPPGPIGPLDRSGLYLIPDRWVTWKGALYAVAYVDWQGTRYPIARRVYNEGALGPVFLVRPLPVGAELPEFMTGAVDRQAGSAEAAGIRDWYAERGVASWWGAGLPRHAVDGARLIEPVRYRARDGVPVLLQRSMPGNKSEPENNHRLYVSFGDGKGGWSVPHPTDIPDAPSRCDVQVLADGTTLLLGNSVAPEFDVGHGNLPRDPLTVALSRDGYTFDRVFAVRANAPKQHRFAGIRQRGLGFGYPSSVVCDGWLYVLYSIGKEDMGFTRVPLSALGISQ